mgnify:CR=1 FL=1
MFINKVRLLNFRNYEEQEIDFNKNINIFYGDNAQGKTNIIESIFISSIGKSFRAKKDKELILLNKEYSSIEVFYEKKDRNGKIKIDISDKKEIFVNGIKIKKLSDLLGNINIVLFTPDDINILKNGPSTRRKFLDIMIGQLRPTYVYILNLYNKTISQRNMFLKQSHDKNINIDMLDVWDENLKQYAYKIYKYRKEFIEKIKIKINQIHRDITEGKEEIKIHYISDCENMDIFSKKLKSCRNSDIERGYTLHGVHKDDFTVYINGKQVNIYGSQGQHRTAILSLKMAELQVAKDEIGEDPIFLLDDFMSELDEKRRKNFLKSIGNMQVILTGTDKIEIDNVDYNLYYVEKGKILKSDMTK